ncbi:LysR family transcriptional regulator [Paraburkholderia fungorum]|uniref:helix-turn-helix domain-containing protein n=1 Tax=Paraburkholderia fungorum TaxID=134537 RepID=UPI0038B7C9EC
MSVDDKLRQWATKRQAEVLDAIEKFGSQRAAAEALGLSHGTVGDSVQALKKKAAKSGYAPDHDFTRPVPDGFLAQGVSTYYNKDGKPSGQWVKASIDKDRQEEIFRAACDAMSETLPRVRPAEAPSKTDAALCNLAVFSDYHIGMLAWEKEGGGNWDLKIAESLLLASFIHMIESAPKAKTCVLCLQGDQLHVDSLLPVTPAHHHVLDADGRFSKIVGAAVRVIRRLIDHALSKHEHVHLIICEGNHDESGSVWMRHMFAALYEDEPRLSVTDSELPFYVYQHGETMLAFHHGHKVKNEQLPMLFAAQFPKVWGATTKRFAHCGHRHHVDEKEYAGMTVVQHPTLAARDAYAARGGWISDRAASIITYHERYGQVARTIVCPEMFEAA